MRLLALAVGLVFIAAFVKGNPCNCGLGPGANVCGHGSNHGSLVIRPDPYISPSVKQQIELQRIENSNSIIRETVVNDCNRGRVIYPSEKSQVNPCSCRNTFVTPAHIPSPPCRQCGSQDSIGVSQSGQTSFSQSESSSVNSQIHQQGRFINSPTIDSLISKQGLSEHNYNQYQHQNRLCNEPADPVSLAIAIKQQIHNRNIPRNSCADRDIAFGFQKLPLEVRAESKQRINEGNLNSINGQVLELKLSRPSVSKTVDEEAFEELIADPEEEIEHYGRIRSPSLAEIGFINARVQNQKFVDLKSEVKGPVCGVDALAKCNDGFRPGNVILKQNVQLPRIDRQHEAFYVGGEQRESRHAWSSGSSNTIFKKVGASCGCSRH